MIDEANQILTATALAGTLVARYGMREIDRRSAVASRLRTLYSLIAALLALRLLQTVWPMKLSVAMMMIVAAWLPFLTLRLAEELVRRHASRLVKFAALGGSVGFSVLALTFGLVWSAPAIIALAVFQAIMLLCVLGLLWQSRGGVSVAERQAIYLFALALLLTVPLALTDFQAIFSKIPVRGGVFAVFLMLLATSRLIAGGGRPVMLLADCIMALGSGAAMALALTALLPEQSRQTIFVVAACSSAVITLVILVERFAQRTDSSTGLVHALAQVHPDAGLDGLLAAHPLLAQALMIDAMQLGDFPDATLEGLAKSPMVDINEYAQDAVLGDAARELLDRYAASHLLRISAHPPRFLAVAASGLSGAHVDDELAIAARMLESAA